VDERHGRAAGVRRRGVAALDPPPRPARRGGARRAAGAARRRRRPRPTPRAGWWFDLATDAWARAEFGELFGIAPGPAPAARDARGCSSPPRPTAATACAWCWRPSATPAAAPPSPEVTYAVAVLARAAAGHLGRTRLGALAAAGAERLRRLHEAGVALARSLDEGEAVRELARQVARSSRTTGSWWRTPTWSAAWCARRCAWSAGWRGRAPSCR
jgi:hypothetical protein